MNNYKEDNLVMMYDYYNGKIITLCYINMEIYLIDPQNVHFSCNIEYIPYAYHVYTYSENQLYIYILL